MSPRSKSLLASLTLSTGLCLCGILLAQIAGPPVVPQPIGDPLRGLAPRSRQVDQAVVRALEYLASQQTASGAWNSPALGQSPACTSLAIMAFLAAGHTPDEGPYARLISRGVEWVLDQQSPNGLIADTRTHGPLYSHGICTLMLAEVLGMTSADSAPDIRQALERAVEIILIAQEVKKDRNHAGGWRYTPQTNDSDLSVTGWQLLALRGAKNVGCDIPAECIDRAVAYVKMCAEPQSGGFCYMPYSGATSVRTGTGILCLEICGEHHSAEALSGAHFLKRRPLMGHDQFFYYGVYYCTLGMFQMGGEFWEMTRDHLAPLLLTMQRPNGCWDPARGEENIGGTIYCTSMAVLALTVEYQYLPIYQR